MTKIETVWEKVQPTNSMAGGDSFHLIRIDPHSQHNFSAGKDDEGSLLLSLEVISRPPVINIESESLDYFRKQRANGSWLMVLRLSKPGLQEVYGQLCQDLVDSADLMLTEAAAINLFRERLLLWRKLFLSETSAFLEAFEVKGLMAELLFLKALLEKYPEKSTESVNAWTGPKDYPQDFTFANKAYEIKSTFPTSVKITISSKEQLDFHGSLYLCVYFLQETSPSLESSITLVNLTSSIEALLAGKSDATSVFRDKLLRANYVEHEYYEKIAFQLIEIINYRVSNDFPRLYSKNVGVEITDITYSLSLNQIGQFVVEDIYG